MSQPDSIIEVIQPLIADLVRDGFISDKASVVQEITQRMKEALEPFERYLDAAWEANQGEDL